MNILITGGGGMLAHALSLVLTARDIPHRSIPRAQLDITDAAAIDAALAEHRPTHILNTAAHTKVDLAEVQRDLAHAINATGPRLLAAAADRIVATLVHYSTDFVFSGNSAKPWLPTDPTAPLSIYGQSKLAGERALANTRHYVLRTSWLYGPGGPCFPVTMVKAARAGKPLAVVADQHGSPTYTLDLATATLDLLARAAPPGTYHVSNTGETTWRDFTVAILAAFDLPLQEVKPLSTADWARLRPDSAPRPHRSTLDVSATEAAIGRPMRPWKQALADYAASNPL